MAPYHQWLMIFLQPDYAPIPGMRTYTATLWLRQAQPPSRYVSLWMQEWGMRERMSAHQAKKRSRRRKRSVSQAHLSLRLL